MCRIEWYSTRIPFAPSKRRASRAHSVAILTLLRLTNETCDGVIVRDADNNMKRIVEKPTDPVSKLANIGLYYIKDWKLLFKGIEDVMEGPTGKTSEYYLTDAFQFQQGGPDADLGAIVFDVTGLPNCGLIKAWRQT